MIETMRMFELVAANTMFQPRKKQSNATFVQNVAKDKSSDIGNPEPNQKSLLGRSLSVKYKGKKCKGTVKFGFASKGKRRWAVAFEDGYESHYGEAWVKDQLLEENAKRKRRFSQIDYIIVSKRWLSSVLYVKTLWGPSIHRNIYMESQTMWWFWQSGAGKCVRLGASQGGTGAFLMKFMSLQKWKKGE